MGTVSFNSIPVLPLKAPHFACLIVQPSAFRLACLCLLAAIPLGPTSRAVAQTAAPPSRLLGSFIDDYGSQYTVTADSFQMLPRSFYQIVEWNTDSQFIIAKTAAGDTAHGTEAATIWLRIDWMEFPNMEPYTWGFCFTAYEAPSAEAARATPSADRSAPRTGCGGYPFSRMRRTDPHQLPGPVRATARVSRRIAAYRCLSLLIAERGRGWPQFLLLLPPRGLASAGLTVGYSMPSCSRYELNLLGS